MENNLPVPEKDFINRLKWLMFFRVLITSLLLGSTIILQLDKSPSPLDRPLLVLYGMIAGVFILSFIYALAFQHIHRPLVLAYAQITIDTVFVTLIIFVTGSFSSIFTFLYLLVIIYSSLFLSQTGSMLIAAFCSIQYGIMVNLEFYNLIQPFIIEGTILAENHPWSLVLYKLMSIIVACFAVAFLSGLLSGQVRKTKMELAAMEDHIKRVEKMAYMGKMAANMAHEIKNPLASLAGSIQLLRSDLPFDPGHDKLMQIVLRETNRLSDLVNDFLMFAKPHPGKSEIIELEKALNEAIGLFEKNETCRDRITVNKSFVPGIWIKMDPLHLHQVLWNLLLNAAEAIKGNGTITVKTQTTRNSMASIRISDDGCGMSRDLLQTVFDPFFTTKSNGTGLGLSIVHSILESYGSRLDIESFIGRGTTVNVKLTQMEAPAD